MKSEHVISFSFSQSLWDYCVSPDGGLHRSTLHISILIFSHILSCWTSISVSLDASESWTALGVENTPVSATPPQPSTSPPPSGTKIITETVFEQIQTAMPKSRGGTSPLSQGRWSSSAEGWLGFIGTISNITLTSYLLTWYSFTLVGGEKQQKHALLLRNQCCFLFL